MYKYIHIRIFDTYSYYTIFIFVTYVVERSSTPRFDLFSIKKKPIFFIYILMIFKLHQSSLKSQG